MVADSTRRAAESSCSSFFLWFTDSLVQRRDGRVSGQWNTEKSAASWQWGVVLGSGVRGQDPSRPVGYLAVGCIEYGQVPSGLGGVLGSGVRGQDPSWAVGYLAVGCIENGQVPSGLGGVLGRFRAGWVGYLAVGCIGDGQRPSGLGGVLGGGVCGQGPSRFIECARGLLAAAVLSAAVAQGCSRPPSSRQPLRGGARGRRPLCSRCAG
jgi:hypothetical protein